MTTNAKLSADQIEVSVEQLRGMLERGEPVTVLDVRSAPDRAEWSIPGSLHRDVYEALWRGDPRALADFVPERNRPVITVCGRGHTSLRAVSRLRARGIPSASLRGGMQAWSLAWNTASVPVPGSSARVIQVRRTGKGCLSYMIGSEGVAAVIDPSVDPAVYLDLAGKQGWKITDVLDTHVHADHLSRSRRLAQASTARLWLPEQQRVKYPFAGLKDGQELQIGRASLKVIATPGHTFESVCYLLDGQAAFTGDTLFLAGVGRPDLAAKADEETRERARLLFGSLQRLKSLPPTTVVLPGHTSEPVAFDGTPLVGSLADVWNRTELVHRDEAAFVEALVQRLPESPANYRQIVKLNEEGRLPDDPTALEAGANRCAVG